MSAHRYWRLWFPVATRMSQAPSAAVAIGELEMRESNGGTDATGSGTAAASTLTGSFTAASAFDNTVSTSNGWKSSTTHNGSNNALVDWLSYDFGSGVTKDIIELYMTCPATGTLQTSANDTPSTFLFQWSDDNIHWTTQRVINGLVWTLNTSKTIDVSDDAGASQVFIGIPTLIAGGQNVKGDKGPGMISKYTGEKSVSGYCTKNSSPVSARVWLREMDEKFNIVHTILTDVDGAYNFKHVSAGPWIVEGFDYHGQVDNDPLYARVTAV